MKSVYRPRTWSVCFTLRAPVNQSGNWQEGMRVKKGQLTDFCGFKMTFFEAGAQYSICEHRGRTLDKFEVAE